MLYFIVVLCTAGLAQSTFTDEELREQFEAKIDTCAAFYLEHGYSPPAKDDPSALQLFITAYHTINQHNSNPARKYNQVLNCFATVKDTHHSLIMSPPTMSRTAPAPLMVSSNIGGSPDSYDRRDDNTSTSVKDQMSCGSCWAFSAIAAIESKYLDLTGDDLAKADFSEQQLLDCTYQATSGQDGCDGGWMSTAWARLQDEENSVLYNETQRPYANSDGVCNILELGKPNAMRKVVMRSPAYGWSYDDDIAAVMGNATQERLWLHSAISIAIRVESAFDYYDGGVFDTACSGSGVNHAITLVGYTQTYFTAKNSWGVHWGDAGHIRLSRTDGNLCEIFTWTMWPKMECNWGTNSTTGKCNNNLCEGISCLNGGTCNITTGLCKCMMGDNCEVENQCAGIECLNGGTCNSANGQLQCACTDGWMGNNCDVENQIKQCVGMDCLNGGLCNSASVILVCVIAGIIII